MFPVYAGTIAASILLSVLSESKLSDSGLFGMLVILFVCLIFGSSIGTVLLLAQRFNKGLMGNEGYLYFSLPVRTSGHIVSKLCNALIWGFLQIVVVVLSGALITFITGEVDLRQFFSDLKRALPMIDADTWLSFGKVMLLMFLEIVAIVCFVYLCQSIGHLFKNHRTFWTFAAAIAIIIVRGQLMPDPAMFNENTITWYILPVVSSAIYLLGTWFILDRKLNLE